MSVRGFFGFLLGGLPPFEVSCDFHLVVCMGECTQIFWIPFGGQQVSSISRGKRFISCLLLLLQKVDLLVLSMPKRKFTG